MNKKFRISIFIGGFFLFYLLFIIVGGLAELIDLNSLRFVIDHNDGIAVFTSPLPFLIIYIVMYQLFKWIHTDSPKKISKG
ncbi:DUF3935 domain-containing protein [Domibacillus robiginosus]|uniref:DUF3935 domain-containing protein n=1 Tax=Domibacillus robiginosus TaxID=1071054 RepID=UPI00067D1CED|nr:DUF3935 domain-containing protein [Domibacillus robiginosus]